MAEQLPQGKVTGPVAGSAWYRPPSRGVGFVINKPAETRHVVDRTLGGGVVFVSGRFSRRSWRQQTVTLHEWLDWAHDAKEVNRDRQ